MKNLKRIFSSKMEIKIIKAYEDNYSYILIDKNTKKCAVIDGVGFNECNKIINSEKLELDMILTTHHHWDHSGENDNWNKLYNNIPIYCSKGKYAKEYPDILNLGNINVFFF